MNLWQHSLKALVLLEGVNFHWEEISGWPFGNLYHMISLFMHNNARYRGIDLQSTCEGRVQNLDWWKEKKKRKKFKRFIASKALIPAVTSVSKFWLNPIEVACLHLVEYTRSRLICSHIAVVATYCLPWQRNVYIQLDTYWKACKIGSSRPPFLNGLVSDQSGDLV